MTPSKLSRVTIAECALLRSEAIARHPTIRGAWCASGEQDSWPHDVWRIVLRFSGRTLTIPEYSTGIGHRYLHPEGTRNDYLGPMTARPRNAASLLASVIHDGELGSGLFRDFCTDAGLEMDSRVALATYLQCQEYAYALRSFFGVDRDAIERELAELGE